MLLKPSPPSEEVSSWYWSKSGSAGEPPPARTASVFIRGSMTSQVPASALISMPALRASEAKARAWSWRILSPEVYQSGKAARTPSLARMPSSPGFHPASSRIFRARSRSWVRSVPAVNHGLSVGTGP